MALDSDTALVGACLKTVGAQSADGVTFVFTPSGGTWSQQAQISAADGAANDNLGDAVALSGDTALVGAPNHGGVGAVYVEQLSVGYTLTYQAGPGGSIAGTTPQVVAPGGNGTQVTAVADNGYHFSGWSDGVTSASRTDTEVQADLTVTAGFVANPTIPPTTAMSGLPKGWTRRPVTLQFTATPASGGGAVAYTEHRLGSGEWLKGTSVTIKREGTITVWYRSADIYGNLETAKSCTVRIDTIPPTVRDGDAVVLRGAGPAAFTYRLADNLSTRLSCRLVVTQLAGRRSSCAPASGRPAGG